MPIYKRESGTYYASFYYQDFNGTRKKNKGEGFKTQIAAKEYEKNKSKVGYEIPITRYFYKYEASRSSAEIMAEILDIRAELDGALTEVFDV